MKKQKTIWIVLTVVLVLGSFTYGLAMGTYHLPPYEAIRGIKNALDAPTPTPPPAIEAPQEEASVSQYLPDILRLIEDQGFETQTETIDFVRDFVYLNSVHKLDKEFWEYAYDTPRVLDMLYETYSQDAPPPHLVCDPRSYALAMILDELSIQSRTVYMYTDDFIADEDKGIQSHTFLEVYNEDFGRWEVQDTDYNIYWEHIETGQRVGVMQLVLDDLSHYAPRSFTPEVEAFAAERLPPYFEVMIYPQDKVGVVNIERFDPANPFLETREGVTLIYVQGMQ